MFEIPLTAVYQTYQQIQAHVRQTPLVYSPFLSEKTGGGVWLKLENQQPTGAFKIRGALSKMVTLSAAERKQGIVAASAGNHALGVAYAAQVVGEVQADIFVPTTAPAAKVEKLRRFPVTVHQVGASYDATHHLAAQFLKEQGGLELSAYDDLAVINGQATVGLEIFQTLPAVDMILVPVGGGGLIAGISSVVHQMKPACDVIGVQPVASPAALLSFQQGAVLETYDHAPTIADGLAGGFGAIPFRVMQAFPPAFRLVEEADIRRALFALVHYHQLIIEPAGAAAVAPLLDADLDLHGKTVVCVLTGGNLDTSLLRSILNEFKE